MFEQNTYDAIMERIMERIDSSIATDEGSFVYTAAGPVGIEHEQIYAALDAVLDAAFIVNAPMKYLILAGKAYGLEPHPATPAVWSAVVAPSNMSVRVGTRFNCGEMNLVTTGKVADGVWELTCETPGAQGNTLNSDLIPITYVYGLESIVLYELLESGVDEESEDDFRDRILFHIQKPAATGNVNNYIEWATSVDGVGAAKVFPIWNGPGTVKVVITDSDKRAASSALVNAVSAYINTVRPVGASVTVTSGTEVAINVVATVVIETGYTIATIQRTFRERLAEYLEENAYKIEYLPISHVKDILLNTDGVFDYSNLRVNDDTENIDLTAEQIAVIGTVSLEVQA